jgi:hypothetical protein
VAVERCANLEIRKAKSEKRKAESGKRKAKELTQRALRKSAEVAEKKNSHPEHHP